MRVLHFAHSSLFSWWLALINTVAVQSILSHLSKKSPSFTSFPKVLTAPDNTFSQVLLLSWGTPGLFLHFPIMRKVQQSISWSRKIIIFVFPFFAGGLHELFSWDLWSFFFLIIIIIICNNSWKGSSALLRNKWKIYQKIYSFIVKQVSCCPYSCQTYLFNCCVIYEIHIEYSAFIRVQEALMIYFSWHIHDIFAVVYWTKCVWVAAFHSALCS